MKLLSCHIEHFGKLKDFTYDFEDGLNILFEENGWGKSTLAAFLRVMFYGFEGENRHSETANERTRFRPWNGGTYGGSMIFTCDGDSRRYRVLRTFGSRRKEDSFRLLDDATGLPSEDFSQNLGEELFGIDAESFRRSIFLAQSVQNDCTAPATAAISAKIGDLAGEDSDMRQYDAAKLSLKKETDRLTPDRSTGRINKAMRELSSLRAETARMPYLTSTWRKLTAQEEELRVQISQIQKQREDLAAKAAQWKSAHEAAPEANTISKECETAVRDLAARTAASRKRLEILHRTRQSILTEGRLEQEDYRQIRQERCKEQRRVQGQHMPVYDRQSEVSGRLTRTLFASGFTALAAAFSLLFLTLLSILPVWCLIPAVSLLCLSTGLFLGGRNMRTQKKNSVGGTGGYRKAGSVPARETAAPDKGSVSDLHQLRAEEARSRERLRTLSGKLRDVQRQIKTEEAKYSALKEQYRSARAGTPAKAAVSEEEGCSPRGPVMEASPYAADYAALALKEQQMQSSLMEISHRMQETGGQLRRCEDACEECRSLEEKIDDMKHRYEIYTHTAEFLERAKNTFTARYRGPFLRALRKYYIMMTESTGENLHADASLNVTVSEDGLPRDPSLLSEGSRDLIALCRRMAMADAMYPGEKPFLILDDPFAGLDDTRIEGGLRFLQSASSDYQILYLTCHSSRVPEWNHAY